MDYLGILLSFAVVHLLTAVSPGPNLIVVSSYSATLSRRAGLVMLGILLAVLTWSSATALGLGVVVANNPSLYEIIQYAGAAYLVWIGLNMFVSAFANNHISKQTGEVVEEKALTMVVKGYLVNMTNPKTIAYYTSLFAVLISPDSPQWVFGAAVVVAFFLSAFWWIFVVFVFSTDKVQMAFMRMRRYLELAMGNALILLGLRLAINR